MKLEGDFRDGTPDLSRVIPGRRDLVRHRIAAIEEYDRLPERTWQDLVRICETVGLAPASFSRLWRSWRTLRDPEALQGQRRGRRVRDQAEDREAVRQLLLELPETGTIERAVLGVENLAADRGIKVRSRSALRRLIRDFREEAKALPLSGSSMGTIGIDMVPIELAVDLDGQDRLPMTTLVLHPRSGSVLSALLSFDPPSAALAARSLKRWLAEVAEADEGVPIDHVLIAGGPDADLDALSEVLIRHGIGSATTGAPPPLGSIIAGSLGRTVLGLETRPRMVNRDPADRRPLVRSTRLASSLDLSEAQKAIDERIAASNRPVVKPKDASALLDALACRFVD